MPAAGHHDQRPGHHGRSPAFRQTGPGKAHCPGSLRIDGYRTIEYSASRQRSRRPGHRAGRAPARPLRGQFGANGPVQSGRTALGRESGHRPGRRTVRRAGTGPQAESRAKPVARSGTDRPRRNRDVPSADRRAALRRILGPVSQLVEPGARPCTYSARAAYRPRSSTTG